jgi:glycosyltransferase involved in cell wall biosynthesis
MKIVYIANIRLPTEKAHGAQIMKACEAFVRAGAELELVVPNRRTPIQDDVFAYYGVKTPFKLTRLPTLDTIRWGRLGFILQSVLFGFRAARYVGSSPAIVYGRDEIVLVVISFLTKKKIFWESHDGAWNIWARYLAKRTEGMVVVTKGAVEFYSERGVPASKLFAVANGIDLEEFAAPESKEAARQRLGLPIDKKVALYIGRLDGWKGTKTLFEASELLPTNILVAAIGGEKEQVEKLRSQYPKVRFFGFRPFRELGDNQTAADILVLPNTATSDVSVRFSSPMKLFSYMAAGKPIVASDLPSIREILNDTNAIFFTPDDARSLAGAIEKAATDQTAMARIGEAARKDAMRYTWNERAKSILAFLQNSQ